MNHRISRPPASNLKQEALITVLMLALFACANATGAENNAITFDLPAPNPCRPVWTASPKPPGPS